MRKSLTKLLSLFLFFGLLACSQSQPLSVTMIHPKTKAVATCAARESERVHVPVEILSNAVATCVKQLEARGYKRAD
jgi:hypothetical protein